jgi:hypothetical protein
VVSLHYALHNGKLVALDTEFENNAKDVRQADTPAASMGMSTGATSSEYTPNSIKDLADQDVCLFADKVEYADQVSQWAASDTLDAQNFARTPESGGREEAMNGLENANIFRAVFKMSGGKKKSFHAAGGQACSLELGAVFEKPALKHLHSALCYWHNIIFYIEV